MALLDKVMSAFKSDSDAKSGNDDLLKIDEAKSEQELFGFLKSKVDEQRSSATRIAHEGVWMTNCAYVVGFAGLYFNTSTRTFQPVNRASGYLKKNRLFVNKLLPNLQNRLAKLTKNPPRFDVRPNGNDQTDKDNARFKLDILIAKWDQLKINQKRQQVLMWAQQCGHAYMGVTWDDTMGEMIQDPMTGEMVNEGELRVEEISPFEIFPDPLAKNFEEAKFFLRCKVRPLHYFRDHYGDVGAKVKEEDIWLLSAQYDARINTMNTRGFSSSNAPQTTKNCAIEITYYERPCRKYPKGRMIIGANGVILKNDELPTGKIPLIKFDDIVVAGKYYSESVVTHARPVQDQYNSVIRRRADWVNRMLAGKFVSPRGNELIREALTDENAEILQYTPVPNAPGGGEPKALDIPLIPQYAYNEEDKLDAQFSEIMGISEVSKGQLPSASIPALGMQILVEADDTRIGVEILNHEFSYADLGGLILDYVQKFYVTPRKMKFAGKNSYTIKDVQGDQLEGSNDVIVIPGSTIPGSKALRRQEILNTYSQGLLGDPNDSKVKQNVLAMIELGDVGEMFVDNALDQFRAKYEIDSIKAGVLPDIGEEFNHVICLQELARFRKSDEWERLNDDQKEIYEGVKEEHLRFLGELTGTAPDNDMAQAEALQAQAKGQADMPNETLPEAPPPQQPPQGQ